MIHTAISLLAASAVRASRPSVSAEDAYVAPAPAPDQRPTSKWFVRGGVTHIFYESSARITTDGTIIPGSTAGVPNDTTVTFDVGYDLSENVSLVLMGGFPPMATVVGQGSVSRFGKLGHVRFGPAILTATYRLPAWHGYRPYIGAGGAHLFILKTEDGSVTELKVRDHNGFVLQAGVERPLSRKWEIYADYKHIWLNVHASGLLAGEPVRAKVTLNPDLISAGIKYHFG